MKSMLLNQSGSTAVTFALALVPMLGLAGAAIDYSRGAAERSRLIAAVDAAALTAAREHHKGKETRDKIARDVFRANLGVPLDDDNAQIIISEANGVIRVVGELEQANLFGSFVGSEQSLIRASAETGINDTSAEIALVLDNTGSMKNDMPALKAAANKLIDIVFRFGESDNIRMSIVPFNSAVNVGVKNLPTPMLDGGGQSKWHALALRSYHVADFIECTPIGNGLPGYAGGGNTPPTNGNNPGGGGGGGNGLPVDPANFPGQGNAGPGNGNNGGGNGVPPINPGNGGNLPPVLNPGEPRNSDKEDKKGKKAEYPRALSTIASVIRELFGIHGAVAQVTPNTTPPFSGTWINAGPGYTPTSTAYLPDGFKHRAPSNPCGMNNPPIISHLDLFNRIPGSKWKGCVEARPEPYDVTDDPPSAGNPNTLFVPYFWPDEPGSRGGASAYNNNYMDDTGILPAGWKNAGWFWAAGNIFKYNGMNVANLDESPPNTLGPNAACPDELLRLTKKKKDIVQKIESLNYWHGGGTVVTEGIMWGWRTLSPKAPFADGATGDKVRKFMVVMSDGAQNIEENNPTQARISDYNAYGYIRYGRFPAENFASAETYLDQRAALACANAKKAGIRIFTILFRETGKYAQDLMRQCASDPSDMYIAADEAQLTQAFEYIGGAIAQLRLLK